MKPINKHPLRLLATSLLLLAAGCTDVHNDERNTPGAPIEIDFAVPTLASVNPATRALANAPLPVNSTVRITPYNKRKQVFEPSATYYVDASNKLQPYTSQNSDGSFVAGAKMQVILNDIYAFYFSTPALPITSDGHKQTVENNVDFASYISGDCRIMGNDSPTPPVLARRCSQIVVQVKGIGSTTALALPTDDSFVQFMKLRSPQAGIAPGTYIPTMGGTADQSLRISKGTAAGKDVTFEPFCVLPCTSSYSFDIVVRLALTVTADNTPHTKTVTYSTKLANTEFKPGFQYNVTLTLDPEKAEVLPSVTITEWVDGGVVTTDPEKDYPYVTTNAAGKKCVVVIQDMFGGVMDIPNTGMSLHDPWLQTPTHTLNNMSAIGDLGIGYSSSPRFEVAKSNSPGAPTAWGSTNNGCTLPWRRPTILEAMAINWVKSKLSDIDEILTADKDCWTATEYSIQGSEGAWTLGEQGAEKTASFYTRCVRDYGIASPNYAHVIDGKFIISQDEYGTTGGTFHPKWGSNDVPNHNKDDVKNNTVSARFEVSRELRSEEIADHDVGMCSKYSQTSGAAGTWRVPTLAELYLLYDLRAQLPANFWEYEIMSSTHTGNGVSYWCYNPVYGPLNSGGGAVRCVRDY